MFSEDYFKNAASKENFISMDLKVNKIKFSLNFLSIDLKVNEI